MLAPKRSTGVTPEIIGRNPLYAGNEACKQGIYPGFEIKGRPIQGYQWPHKKD